MQGTTNIGNPNHLEFSTGVQTGSPLSLVDEKINRVAKDQFSFFESLLFIGTVGFFAATIFISSSFWPLGALCFYELLRLHDINSTKRKNEMFLEDCNQNLRKIADFEKEFPQITAEIPAYKTKDEFVEYFQFIKQLSSKWASITSKWASINLEELQANRIFGLRLSIQSSRITNTLKYLNESLEDLCDEDAKHMEENVKHMGKELKDLNQEIASLKTNLNELTSPA